MKDLTLSLRDLSLTFENGVRALRGVSLTLTTGEFLVLAGSNGAGKSALLRVAARLIPPSEGELSVDFAEGSWDERAFRNAVRLVVQHPARYLLGQTVREELQIAARTAEATEADIEGQLRYFGLESVVDRAVHALSGGEQRRLALAGAIIGSPRLLLFDEPFLELDYPSTRSFLSLLQDLRRRGCGIVVATHDYHRTLAHADRMVLLSSGTVAVDASPEEGCRRASEFGLRPPGEPVEALTWLGEG
ncbi:MAG: energy-coupling factor ABC transporter ATP-binding protein [Alkalispirochaetaceae bacterium]